MIIRFQSREGGFRLTLDNNTDIADILPDVLGRLPKNVIPATVTISPRPHGADSRPIEKLRGVTFAKLGLTHGTQVFLDFQTGDPGANGHSEAANKLSGKEGTNEEVTSSVAVPQVQRLVKNPWDTVKQIPLDDRLDKLDGKITRKKDHRMCKHGPKGMCDYCQPLEPYDKGFLEEHKIKHLSYHAHLRKLNQGKNKYQSGSSYIPPLSEPYYRVNPECPGGHAPFPDGICSKCQPSAISLVPQEYRMVDHVEFETFDMVDKFIGFWRQGGAQRIAFLYGHYEEYDQVPLGTKAVVEAIYEPPQVDEPDGVTLNDWNNEKEIEQVAELSGLQRVGVIFTDLIQQTDPEKGLAVCKRHADSYYLSSLEVCFASKYQAKYPRPSKWSETGKFGSNFVTCIISGDADGNIAISAYQASNAAVEMTTAEIIEPSAEPSVMLVQDEAEADEAFNRKRYIPEVFYRRINEYGANVQENAKPSFPVEYLFVTLTHGFPNQSNPKFVNSSAALAIENRDAIGELQDQRDLVKQLKAGANWIALDTAQGVAAVSDFHLLCYIQGLGVLGEDELRLLCQVATTHDTSLGAQLMHTPGWKTLNKILEIHGNGERPRKRGSTTTTEASALKRFRGLAINGK